MHIIEGHVTDGAMPKNYIFFSRTKKAQSFVHASAVSSIQVESLLLSSGEQPLPQYHLGRVIREFQVMRTGIHRRIRAVACINFLDDGKTRLQIRQTAGRK